MFGNGCLEVLPPSDGVLPGAPEEKGGPPAPTLGHLYPPGLLVAPGTWACPGNPLNCCSRHPAPSFPVPAPQLCPLPQSLLNPPSPGSTLLPAAEAGGLLGSRGSPDTYCPLLGCVSAPLVWVLRGYVGAPRDLPWQGRIPASEYITFRISPSPTPTPTPPYAELVPLLAPFPPPPYHGQQHPGLLSLALGCRTVCPAPRLGPFLSTLLLVPWGPSNLCISPGSSAPSSPLQPPVETWQLTFRAVLGAVGPFSVLSF